MRSAQSWRRTLVQPVGGGEINGMALLGSVLACGCQDGSVRLFRVLKEAGAFVLYSLMRREHGVASARLEERVDERADAAAPAVNEVMCVALSALASRSAPTVASGAQVSCPATAAASRREPAHPVWCGRCAAQLTALRARVLPRWLPGRQRVRVGLV